MIILGLSDFVDIEFLGDNDENGEFSCVRKLNMLYFRNLIINMSHFDTVFPSSLLAVSYLCNCVAEAPSAVV